MVGWFVYCMGNINLNREIGTSGSTNIIILYYIEYNIHGQELLI